RRAAFRTPPKIASAPALAPGLEECRKHGFNPPLPGNPNAEKAARGAQAALRARAPGAGLHTG
ncbi:MAG TPA: hypothetical protein VHR88_10610, partial [Solirubrobacteraceae bacterium]|nr:hypothetical protein [Solirubrobacteraceae bacterium]